MLLGLAIGVPAAAILLVIFRLLVRLERGPSDSWLRRSTAHGVFQKGTGSMPTPAGSMTANEAKEYFQHRVNELKSMSSEGTPWVFLCGSALIDYLSKLAYGKDRKAAGYKDFVKKYMPPTYRKFAYASGHKDLPEQMYHVLRCGIVHMYSLVPDKQATSKGGRSRSIVLTHEPTYHQLDHYPGGIDACVFRAEEFISDIEYALIRLFARANKYKAPRARIEKWLKAHPPISGGAW
jgi:hypothetical protein